MRHASGRRWIAMLALLSTSCLQSWVHAEKDTTWAVGHPVPIAVQHGSARFVVPTPSATSRTLVVVSTLTPRAGSYPVSIQTSPATHWESPALAEIVPVRPAPIFTRKPIATISPARTTPKPERNFYLQDRDGDPASPSNYRELRGLLGASGTSIQVYVDEQDNDRVTTETLDDIVSTFENHVLPLASAEFGKACDVDDDGRFTVFVSSSLARLAGGRLSVDGFVRGADFEASLPRPLSNHCDMLYLNASLKTGPHLRTVLAHEYTHAAIYCRKVVTDQGLDEEGWLDEAIAHMTEDLHGFSRSNLDHRVGAFLAAPERFRLVVPDYSAAGLIRSHGHRGSTYLFLKWCVDQHGPGLLGSLATSRLRGVANLEAATESRFADLFRGWSVALFLDRIRPKIASTDDPLGSGPRFVRVTPGGPVDRWTADGTSTHFAVLEPSASGALGVEVRGASDVPLQITAIRLPDDLPRIDVAATIEKSPDETTGLRITIENRDGPQVRVAAIGWEPIACDREISPILTTKPRTISGESLRSILDRENLETRGVIVSKLIPFQDLRSEGESIVVRVLAIDSQGRRIAAWAEVTVDSGGHRQP